MEINKLRGQLQRSLKGKTLTFDQTDRHANASMQTAWLTDWLTAGMNDRLNKWPIPWEGQWEVGCVTEILTEWFNGEPVTRWTTDVLSVCLSVYVTDRKVACDCFSELHQYSSTGSSYLGSVGIKIRPKDQNHQRLLKPYLRTKSSFTHALVCLLPLSLMTAWQILTPERQIRMYLER